MEGPDKMPASLNFGGCNWIYYKVVSPPETLTLVWERFNLEEMWNRGIRVVFALKEELLSN